MSRAQGFRPNAQPKGIPRPSRAAATSAALVAVAGADVLSTFDSDAEGWTSVTMCWRAVVPQASCGGFHLDSTPVRPVVGASAGGNIAPNNADAVRALQCRAGARS